jgi:hypothetical protein
MSAASENLGRDVLTVRDRATRSVFEMAIISRE